ncbi:MAG: hypothetical protein CMC96_11625 [Flavobacteriales bacterium]|nr:hypothetical protein [Flavobacteriales bacterium]|tara:strand:- start:25707 stop:27413 length:1707 start_codon:yes stop_codon:yes gene_type:complete
MKKLTIGTTLLLLSLNLLANSLDSLYKIDLKKNTGIAFQYFNKSIIKLDSTEAISLMNNGIAIAKEQKKEPVQALLLGFRAVYIYHNLPLQRERSIEDLESALELLEHQSNYEELKARLNNLLGYYLLRHLNYQLALEKILTSDYQFKQIGYEKIKGVDLYLYNTAVVYFGFQQYDKAIEYLNLSLEYTANDNLESLEANYNLLGVCFSEKGENQKALNYLEKSRKLILDEGDSAKLSMIDCNIGMFYTELNQFDKAKSHLEIAYKNGIKHQRYINAATASLWRAKNEIALQNPEIANIRLEEAKSAFKQLERISPENKKYIYTLEAEVAELNGDYQKASTYKDSMELMNQKIGKMKDLSALADLNVKLITEKHESEMALVEEQSAHQKAQQKLIMVISALIALFLLHLWIQSNRKRKKERLEFEKEKEKSIEQLKNFRQRIKEKNELLEKVKTELQQKSKEKKEEEKSELVQQLSDSIILTEDDWIQFKRLFEQVYPNFLPKVQKEFPELTLAEIRFLALLKMGLSVSEMANTLAILPQSVRKTRQRLMKKLSFSHQKELRQFISNI